ncbi:NSUN6 [Bugula neritina]|uniref:NSUN6 n=1 Tax=Bugula neritina TaxID=10212 RepID=A0A7J7J7J0_BUGNE|nr:NSUN6 [Bugula neritina]
MLNQYQHLKDNLSQPPSFTTLRCNTLKENAGEILKKVNSELTATKSGHSFKAALHPVLTDLIVITNSGPVHREPVSKEVIVDRLCGMAVLRGSDVFASGLLAMSPSICRGDKVSLYVDLSSTCLRGSLPPYEFKKVYLGNGTSHFNRHEVFSSSTTLSGIGISVEEPLYISPKLNNFLPDLVFPQNLPSCICAHVLDPQPGETVLDMCAAPGGKTCHIGTLMQNSGVLIALDKAKKKMDTLKSNLLKSGCTIAQVYCQDASKSVQDGSSNVSPGVLGSPPYRPETFDRILLDAPCSALGQRPSLSNPITMKELSSYPPLQRKLLIAAVKLLKVGGVLVYSTCTFTSSENEGQISWLLGEFPNIQLESQGKFHLNKESDMRSQFPGCTLSNEQLSLLQSFHPAFIPPTASCMLSPNIDTIGFFIAKLRKFR